jgi:hypothetical protein
MRVCWRFAAASELMSSVFHGNQTRASLNGSPISWLPTSKNHDRPDPRKIARYVSSVSPRSLVVRKTTTPLMTNARKTVRSEAMKPPAFCRNAYLAASPCISGPGSSGS